MEECQTKANRAKYLASALSLRSSEWTGRDSEGKFCILDLETVLEDELDRCDSLATVPLSTNAQDVLRHHLLASLGKWLANEHSELTLGEAVGMAIDEAVDAQQRPEVVVPPSFIGTLNAAAAHATLLSAIKAWRFRHMGDFATPAYRAREDLDKLIAESEARSK